MSIEYFSSLISIYRVAQKMAPFLHALTLPNINLQVPHRMFNVSALLLDDALKPSTPLTNSAINENQLIFDEVKAYTNGAKCIPFNITRGVAHFTYFLLFRMQ